MNLKELKELFRLIEKTDFTEVEVSQGDLRLRIERGKPSMVYAQPSTGMPSALDSYFPREAADDVRPTTASVGVQPAETEEESASIKYVTSPFVGTFYRAPSPDSDPYAEVGGTIKKGQPLCIVEAMKLMNEIESDFDGKVLEILVENAQPVEYGQKLFKIQVQ